MSSPAFRRILRRETHSPRTVAMFIAVIALILALIYAGIEVVLWLAGRSALLVGPGVAAAWLIALPTLQPVALIIASGIVIVLLGLVCLWFALTPGRLAKHQMAAGDRAVLVDNGVIASAVAQHLSDKTGISRDDLSVGVSHRTVDVTVRPQLGMPVDLDPIRQVTQTEVDSYQLTPRPRTRVRVRRPRTTEMDS